MYSRSKTIGRKKDGVVSTAGRSLIIPISFEKNTIVIHRLRSSQSKVCIFPRISITLWIAICHTTNRCGVDGRLWSEET
jgi:hypothetical protein